jgi:hypothetical protein
LIPLLLCLTGIGARADDLRIATWNADLSRFGPGLLLRALENGRDPQAQAVVAVIAALDADVLVITDIDFDARGAAVQALAQQLASHGKAYPYSLALRPNTGIATGLDLDGNGQNGQPRDAQGYGRFAGQSGMAILSRLPILTEQTQDYSGLLWADLPGNLMPSTTPPEVRAVQRLSTSGHWAVPVALPDGRTLTLMAWYATPPAFDGPEDRNGRRNHDEAAFWLRLMAGELPFEAPKPPFVLLGQSNCDPLDGDGRCEAVRALLTHPALRDPAPRGTSGRVEPGHNGDPALDTALYGKQGLGGLRVDLVLPSAEVPVTGAGVLWPALTDPMSAVFMAAKTAHFPVWVDIAP